MGTLFCGHGCGFSHTVSGYLLPTCPGCKRETTWTTTAPTGTTVRYPGDPVKPYLLSANDRRFLRSLRIATADEGV